MALPLVLFVGMDLLPDLDLRWTVFQPSLSKPAFLVFGMAPPWYRGAEHLEEPVELKGLENETRDLLAEMLKEGGVVNTEA